AGVAGTTIGLVKATRARHVAEAALKRESEERRKAEAAKADALAKEAEATAIAKFFADNVFWAARPKGYEGGLGSGVSLRDAIVASLPALAKGFANQPLVEARLRHTLGNTFRDLGEAGLAA